MPQEQDNRPDAPSIGGGGTTETVVTKRTTPGVVGVLNYIIDEVQASDTHMPLPAKHGDSILQCLNNLYEYTSQLDWLLSSEAEQVIQETAAEVGLGPHDQPTEEQVHALNVALMSKLPKFDLFSTTEEAVEYWMHAALAIVLSMPGPIVTDGTGSNTPGPTAPFNPGTTPRESQ